MRSRAIFKDTEEFGQVLVGLTADNKPVVIRYRPGFFNFSWAGNNFGVDVDSNNWEKFINFGKWTFAQLKDKLYG